MKRARLMFEKYAKGVEVVCAPADFEMSMATERVSRRARTLALPKKELSIAPLTGRGRI
jgi:hypothetical protein